MEKVPKIHLKEFLEKIQEYEEKEDITKEFAYRVCRKYVEWAYKMYEERKDKDKTVGMLTDAVWTFLFVWNQPVYVNAKSINFNTLKTTISNNFDTICKFRKMDLAEMSINELTKYEEEIKNLFTDFLQATIACKSRKKEGKEETYQSKSPVSVAKALHLLAPNFFPLWDSRIAKTLYNCDYKKKNPADAYFKFCRKIALQMQELKKDMLEKGTNIEEIEKEKTLVKRIDEYNFMVSYNSQHNDQKIMSTCKGK